MTEGQLREIEQAIEYDGSHYLKCRMLIDEVRNLKNCILVNADTIARLAEEKQSMRELLREARMFHIDPINYNLLANRIDAVLENK